MRLGFIFYVFLFCLMGHADQAVSTTHSFYSNFLFDENAADENHLNLEGFIENARDRVPDKCIARKDGIDVQRYCNIEEVKKMLGRIHNILFETIYTCASTAPRAKDFSEAVDGKHTPDSHHYASLIHSALTAKGVSTNFFKTPTHYGIHYQDPRTSQELYWCIITAQANKKPAANFREYIKIFNKYKNPEINGKRNITPSDIEMLSEEDFHAICSKLY